MASTAHSGPMIVHGKAPSSDTNPYRSPSPFDMGVAILDPRSRFTYDPGSARQTRAFFAGSVVQTLNVVPSTLAANNIAASQTPVAGTALTLVSSTGAGVTVGVAITNSSTGAAVTGLLALDGAASAATTANSATVGLWNPTTMLARNVRITSAGNDSAATFAVVGYDVYGFPMTETITGANAGVASGAKAFKYIASITPAGTLSGSAVTVGTGDVLGLPLRADYFGDVQIVYNNAVVTASTGFTAAVTTSPATSTTGDVRGTYALQTASNGTRRIQLFQTIALANISSDTGMFGVTQA